ncbi:MAG: FkbM family methyltransferase [Bacteroidota bacterium]
MVFFKNVGIFILLNVASKLGRGKYLQKKVFSSKRLLERNFPKYTNFNFIQVGANDGVSFDNLYEIVVNRKSTGIVIEPIKEYFDELVLNYIEFENIVKENKAVHPTEKEFSIYKVKKKAYSKYPDWVRGIASFNPSHHEALNIEKSDIFEVLVKCDHLMNIINQNSENKKIDYFQVDTEGFDYEVIKMIDFKIIKPKIIKFESISLSTPDISSLDGLLKKQGYYIFKEGNDTVAVDLKKIRLL